MHGPEGADQHRDRRGARDQGDGPVRPPVASRGRRSRASLRRGYRGTEEGDPGPPRDRVGGGSGRDAPGRAARAVILTDTSAWVEYLRATGGPVDLAMQRLARADGILITEPVIMELIAGVGSEPRVETIRTTLAHHLIA